MQLYALLVFVFEFCTKEKNVVSKNILILKAVFVFFLQNAHHVSIRSLIFFYIINKKKIYFFYVSLAAPQDYLVGTSTSRHTREGSFMFESHQLQNESTFPLIWNRIACTDFLRPELI